MSRKSTHYARSRGLTRMAPDQRYEAMQARKGNGLRTNTEVDRASGSGRTQS